jgi:hypothetical protein
MICGRGAWCVIRDASSASRLTPHGSCFSLLGDG